MDEQTQTLTDNPYVGPRTFSEREQARFFGRPREADDLRSLVLSEQVVLFYAQSGAGKSSLVNARLCPDLRAAGFRVLPTARVSSALSATDVDNADNVFTLNLLFWLDEDRHPAQALYAQTLTDYLTDEGLIMGPTTVQDDDLNDDLNGAPPTPNAPPVLLIIDQFEELFTTHVDKWEQRATFFRQVRAALQRAPHLHLLLVIREDFVASLDPYIRLLPGRLQARYGMERLGAEAAEAAIASPVATTLYPFAPNVAAQLVDNLRLIRVQGQKQPQPGQYIEAVQLQVVCYQLWENLRDRAPGPISVDDLQAAGDVDRALADYYEATVAVIMADPQNLCSERELRTWFDQKLITADGLRNFVLQEGTTTAGMANYVVKQLQERFLLHGENRGGGLWFELVHDRFVQPIQAANRAWLLAQNNPITVAARLWRDNNCDPARLLRNVQLSDAELYVQTHSRELGEEEQEFLAASAQQQRLEAEAKRKRELELAQAEVEKERHNAARLRYFIRSLVMLALLSLFATGFALYQYSETNVLKNQLRVDQLALIARSLGSESNLPRRSLLLAVEAATKLVPPRSSAQQTLHSLLVQTGGQLHGRLDAAVYSVAFSPDGKLLASGGYDNTVRLWKVNEANSEPFILRGHTSVVLSVAFSPDGKLLASGSNDNTVRLWKVNEANSEPLVLGGHNDGVLSVAFSPDGKLLASGSWDNTVRLWKVDEANSEPLILRGHDDTILSVAFSPEGKLLASGSADNTIRLWKVDEANTEPLILRGHTAGVYSVVFSPDGKLLASSGQDNTVRLWKVDEANTEPLILRGHDDTVFSVAFSPDGKLLASGSWDRNIQLWYVQVEDLVVLACNIAGRNLTKEEWDQYFPDEFYRQTCPMWPIDVGIDSDNLPTPPLMEKP